MKEPKFKKGDQVVMHGCPEAEKPENKGIIFTCEKDSLVYKNAPGELAFLEGYGSINARYLVIVYPERKRENSPFRMQTLKVHTNRFSDVITELAKREIMFIWGGSDHADFRLIYYKASFEVHNYIVTNIL